MKKVAVITWKFHNYGTVLQAFALNKVLNSQDGISCDLIKYDLEKVNLDLPKDLSLSMIVQKAINRLQLIRTGNKLKGILRKWDSEISLREQEFEKFLTRIPQTVSCEKQTLAQLNKDYDCFVCGSDQIWNPKYFDGSYLLDFVENDKVKISYAASFGTSNIDDRLLSLYKKRLLRLNHVSVREDTGCKMFEQITGKVATHVADPTLLLSGEEWKKELRLKTCRDKYILCYFLGNNEWYKRILTEIHSRLNIPVKVIGTNLLSYTIADSNVIHPDPAGFIECIMNASVILTDSFHGMLFSVNFNRPFFVFQRFDESQKESENGRIKSFMDLLSVKNKYLSQSSSLDLLEITPLTFEQKNKLSDFIQSSKDFLKSSLEN